MYTAANYWRESNEVWLKKLRNYGEWLATLSEEEKKVERIGV